MKKRWISLILAMIMVVSLLGSMPVIAEEVPDMTVSEAFLGILKQMEGFYAQPYWDYGQYSIGYGSYCCPLLDDPWTDPTYKYYMENPITEEQATQLLLNELSGFERSVNNFIKKHGLNLKQHQYDALVSFSYNCGAGWTNELTGYLNTAVRLGDVSNDLIYGLCLWSTAGGKYILIPRRMSEANMYINGEYKSYTEGNSYPDTFKYVFLDGNGGAPKYKIHGYNAADPAPVKTDFSKIPTGKDANGNWFVYDFAGWFTEPVGGTQVTALDGSLANGTTLYAQWKDSSGQVVTPTDTEPEITFPVGGTLKVAAARRTEPVVRDDTMAGRYTAGDRVTIVEEDNDGAGLIWGKTEDGYWVCTNYHGETYVQYDQAVPEVESVYMHKLPNKLAYVQRNEELDITGSVIVLKYKDGSIKARTLAREFTNVTTAFDNTTLGKKTITATFDDEREHQDFTTTFEVEIIKATVTFKNYDGSVLSQQQYEYGEAVNAPGIPAKPEDDQGAYRFVGWDKEITACTGNAEYTAVFEMIPGSQKYVRGDMDGNETVTADDAVYLLLHTMFGQDFYPINQSADVDKSGLINQDDAVYLLLHTMFGQDFYPL